MIYLKQNKQAVLAALAKIAAEGDDLLRRIRGTPADDTFQADVARWFDSAVVRVTALVDDGSALMAFRASYFHDRWHLNEEGVAVSSTGLRLCAYRHVQVPLAALIDIVKEAENAPEDSDALDEIKLNLEDFQAAVFMRLHALHDKTVAELKDVRRLATWTYTNLEPLFLKLAHEELKPRSRRILERFGPRSLLLLGQIIEADT